MAFSFLFSFFSLFLWFFYFLLFCFFALFFSSKICSNIFCFNICFSSLKFKNIQLYFRNKKAMKKNTEIKIAFLFFFNFQHISVFFSIFYFFLFFSYFVFIFIFSIIFKNETIILFYF